MGSMVPGSPNFFQSFMQAYQMGQEEKKRREAEMQAQEERKLRLETLKFEQNRIKLEDKIRAATMNRQGSLDMRTMLQGMPTPRQELPEGIPGPPQPTGPTSMNIPGISVPEMGIDVPGFQAPIQYQEDMQAQFARQQEMAMMQKIREAAGVSGATAQAQADVARQPREDLSSLFGGVAPPGDMADNLLTMLSQQRQQSGQQTFTAEQNRLQRENATRNAGITAGGQVVTVETVDAQGRPVTRVVPRGEALGKEYPKAPTGEAATAGRAARVGLEALNAIETGFRPEYVGPAASRVYSAQEATGGNIPFAAPIDAARSEWLATVANENNRIINQLSGANVPPAEFARIRQGLPQTTDPPQVFQAKLKATRSALGRLAVASGTSVNVQAGQGAPNMGGPARVSSDADYAALPSGTTFIAPDGTQRRKP